MARLALLSVILLLSGQSAHATVVYDQSAITQAQHDFYSSVGGFVVSDNFILSSAASINEVTWVGGSREGSDLSFYIAISSNSGGQPGTVLFSENVSAVGVDLNASAYSAELYSFSAALPFAAAAGTEYWLTIAARVGETGYFWNDGSGGDSNAFDTYADTNIQQDQAFTLSNSAVTPEPASLMLAATGLLGIAGAARRRMSKR